jgi:hypothetical protein
MVHGGRPDQSCGGDALVPGLQCPTGMGRRPCFLLFVLHFFAGVTAAQGSNLTWDHPGYVSDVSQEKKDVAVEVTIPVAPDDEDRSNLSERIFGQKVTREIQMRYEERFGQTRAEQILTVPNRFLDTQVQPGQYRTFQEEVIEQRNFGNFVVRRWVEYHVDRYLKESPAARPVQVLKERVSNLDVKVKKGYKLKFRYSFSSNDLDFITENPYNISNKVSFRLGQGAGPSAGRETVVFLGYPINTRHEILSNYVVERGEIALTGVKRINSFWSATLTGSKTEFEGEKILMGLSWRD